MSLELSDSLFGGFVGAGLGFAGAVGGFAGAAFGLFPRHDFAQRPKQLLIVPGADHVDLYDRMDKIPFDKLTEFFAKNLK